MTIGLSLIGGQTQQTVNAVPSHEQVQKVCEKTDGKNKHCVAVDSGGIGSDGSGEPGPNTGIFTWD